MDELEKQHVLLNMDKDRLKKENAGLIRQLMESGNKANIEFVKAGDKVNMFFEEKRNLNKYNRMSSHIGKSGGAQNMLAFSSKSFVHGTINKKLTAPSLSKEEPDLFAKGPINMEQLLEAEKKEKEQE